MSMLFKRIKDWAVSITSFRNGDVIPVDGPNGTAKMGKDDLLKLTAQNALAGNVAPAFDHTKANDSDGFAYYINEEVIHNGKLYRFIANHTSGAWDPSQVKEISMKDSAKFNLDGVNLASGLKFTHGFNVDNDGMYVENSGWRMGVISVTNYRHEIVKVMSATNTYFGLRFAFVKSFSPTDGNEVDFCDGSGVVTMTPGTMVEKIIPSDCNFILAWAVTNYTFDEIKFFVEREINVEQPDGIRPVVYYNKAVGAITYEFVDNSNAMVQVYPISGYKELYLNYDNIFNISEGFTPVYFADSSLARISGILQVPSQGRERMYARNMKITDFPVNAAYIVMVTYNKNDTAAINCVTASPVYYNSRLLRKIEPTRHNGSFFFQSNWTYVSNWRLNAFEYDVTGCLWLAVDHCISIISDGPYEYVFKLSDDSYMPVWDRTGYTKYGSKIIIPVPPNAVKLIVNSSPVKDKNYYLPRVYSLENVEMDDYFTLDHFIQDEHKVLSLLFIGNSLTQDAVSYLPLLLREVCPDIEFNIYMWYCGGYTLKNQWENKINPEVDADCEIFSICNTDISWVNGAIKMSQVINHLRFDFVCLQEYFNYVESYSAADTIYFNNIVNHIAGLVGFKFEVDCLFHAPKRGDNFESIYTMTKNGNIVILKNTPAVDIFVPGCAIYEACKTSLDALGDLGHLSPDGTHAQEGLPCLLEAYVMLLQILSKLGRPITIEGVTSVVDTSNYASINVPGPNLGTGVVVGTADDYKVAKQVAARSTNKKFAIMSETF